MHLHKLNSQRAGNYEAFDFATPAAFWHLFPDKPAPRTSSDTSIIKQVHPCAPGTTLRTTPLLNKPERPWMTSFIDRYVTPASLSPALPGKHKHRATVTSKYIPYKEYNEESTPRKESSTQTSSLSSTTSTGSFLPADWTAALLLWSSQNCTSPFALHV